MYDNSKYCPEFGEVRNVNNIKILQAVAILESQKDLGLFYHTNSSLTKSNSNKK